MDFAGYSEKLVRPPISIPNNIFLLWDQPKHSWPPVVQFCIDLWMKLNPDWNVEVHNAATVRSLLETDINQSVLDSATIQAKSDMLRAKLLSTRGGIWADATCMPHMPVGDWIDAYARSDFSAPPNFLPGRTICSWFLISKLAGSIMTKHYLAITKYWRTQKVFLPTDTRSNRIVEANWRAFVDNHAAHELRVCPYFWFHYLFTQQLEREEEFRACFQAQRLLQTAGYGFVQRKLSESKHESFELDELQEFLSKTDVVVSKLNWRSDFRYPFSEFRETILRRAGVR